MSDAATRWQQFRQSIDEEIKSKLKMKRVIEHESKIVERKPIVRSETKKFKGKINRKFNWKDCDYY
jgi:hypothetical protein